MCTEKFCNKNRIIQDNTPRFLHLQEIRATYKQVMAHWGHHKNSQLHRELGLGSEHIYTCDFCIRCWTSKTDKSKCNASRRRVNNAVDADRSQVKFKSGEINEIKSKLTHPVNRVIK